MEEMNRRGVDFVEEFETSYTRGTYNDNDWSVFRMGPDRICKWEWAQPLVGYLYVASDSSCSVYGL